MLKSEHIYQAYSLLGIWGAGILWAMIGCNFMPFTQQGLAVFVLAGLSVFSIHCLGFIFSYLYVTEKYYDIVGSICFVTTTAAILWYVQDQLTIRTFILGMAVIVWSLRLGIYLGVRVMKVGKDQRFDKIKVHFGQFAVAWSLSALWVYITAGSAWAGMLVNTVPTLSVVDLFWLSLWIIGFFTEVIADWQKYQFRQQYKNQGKFIKHGLWSLSRHPNYFGELIIWFALAGLAAPVLQGAQYLFLISPCLLYVLLRYISGVNLLEEHADKKFGNNPDYQHYKKTVPTLIPWFGSTN